MTFPRNICIFTLLFVISSCLYAVDSVKEKRKFLEKPTEQEIAILSNGLSKALELSKGSNLKEFINLIVSGSRDLKEEEPRDLPEKERDDLRNELGKNETERVKDLMIKIEAALHNKDHWYKGDVQFFLQIPKEDWGQGPVKEILVMINKDSSLNYLGTRSEWCTDLWALKPEK
jgi:hypothetical protein